MNDENSNIRYFLLNYKSDISLAFAINNSMKIQHPKFCSFILKRENKAMKTIVW